MNLMMLLLMMMIRMKVLSAVVAVSRFALQSSVVLHLGYSPQR
jgi:hypothetical protein